MLGGGNVVGVPDFGVSGEQVDGVGDQAGVFVGRDRGVVGVGVGEVFGGQVQQVARGPACGVGGG